MCVLVIQVNAFACGAYFHSGSHCTHILLRTAVPLLFTHADVFGITTATLLRINLLRVMCHTVVVLIKAFEPRLCMSHSGIQLVYLNTKLYDFASNTANLFPYDSSGKGKNNRASERQRTSERMSERMRSKNAQSRKLWYLQVSVSWYGLMLALRSLRTGPGSMVGRPVAEVVVVHVEEILLRRPGWRLRLRRCIRKSKYIPTLYHSRS